MNLAVVILGAGASARMGRPKLLLPWQGTTVIGHLIDQWQTLGAAPIAIVCAADNARLAEEIEYLAGPTVRRIFNPQPRRGMFSSIQCAAQSNGWDDSLTHFAIVLGDQPHLKPDTLRLLIDFSARNFEKVSQPRFQGSARHPVILPKELFREIASTKHPTLRDFLNARPDKCELIRIDDPGLELDIDRPADYEQALRLAKKSSVE